MKAAPVRTCVGCRRRRVQAELIRLHCDHRGYLRIDRHGAGRGAWVCAETAPSCFDAAAGGKALARALRTRPVSASIDDVRQALTAHPKGTSGS